MHLKKVVEPDGIEPTTSCMPCRISRFQRLHLKCIIFNKINCIASRDFPACPIDTRNFRCYLVARWLLEIKRARDGFSSKTHNQISC